MDKHPILSAAQFLRDTRPSLTDIYRVSNHGAISPRITQAAVLLWDWSAVHYSSRRQDRAFTRLPRDVYARRFLRVARLLRLEP